MTDNAARKPQTPIATQHGIHLVYSRDWPQHIQAAMRTVAQPSVASAHLTHPVSSVTLAVAAIVGPTVLIGHALLLRLHLI